MGTEFSYDRAKYLLIGKIGKPHGLRGEVKLVCFSREPESLQHYTRLLLVSQQGRLSDALKIKSVRPQGENAILKLEALSTREEAAGVQGAGVLIDRQELPETGIDEYYWDDYIGKKLVDTDGRPLGAVEAIFDNGAQDVLVVRDAGNEILIPVTREILVAENSGVLVIDPPPGLVEMNVDSLPLSDESKK